MTRTFFFDTYALAEIIFGNKNFGPFVTNTSIITTRFHLMELHYSILSKWNEQAADFYYQFYLPYVVEIPDQIIVAASRFRHRHKKSKLSYIDYIGYIYAKSLHVPFLTGDKEFRNLENVEFVK